MIDNLSVATQDLDECQAVFVIGGLSGLPILRMSAVKLLTISTDSDTALSDFDRVFSSDPGLAADLLALANSPLYGFRSEVYSLRHAISLLGIETVRSLGFTLAMGNYMRDIGQPAAVGRIWSHSVATAVIAEAMAKAASASVECLYTAGLLHDIGRLGMLKLGGQKYVDVLTGSYRDIDQCRLLERSLFGCVHDDAGSFLARTWGFPERLCDSIRFHHHPVALDGGPLLRYVHLACRAASALGFDEVHCLNQESPRFEDLLPVHLSHASDLSAETLRARIAHVSGSVRLA